ncbi:hypothetical protein C0J52_07414 [Blattella germanica]|nr:hypothetical protein C0J52_07414 [Blattella germanica]
MNETPVASGFVIVPVRTCWVNVNLFQGEFLCRWNWIGNSTIKDNKGMERIALNRIVEQEEDRKIHGREQFWRKLLRKAKHGARIWVIDAPDDIVNNLSERACNLRFKASVYSPKVTLALLLTK